MAVTMSETTASREAEIKLQSTSVDTTIINGGAVSTVKYHTYGAGDGHQALIGRGTPLVGITASFATNVSRAIEEYCNNIKNKINEMQTIDSTGAFKGESVTTAIANFVTGVKEVVNAYITSLQNAEQEIINNVQNVYTQQDTNISGNLNTDSGKVTSQAPQI